MNGFKSIQQDYCPKFLKNYINITAHKHFTVVIEHEMYPMYIGMSRLCGRDFMVRPAEKIQGAQRTPLMDSQSGPEL